MAEWVPIQADGIVVADVIRWKENIYKLQRSRKTKPLRLGEWLITAEVIKEPDAKVWVRLLVRKCEILTNLSLTKLVPISPATEIRRAKKNDHTGKARTPALGR